MAKAYLNCARARRGKIDAKSQQIDCLRNAAGQVTRRYDTVRVSGTPNPRCVEDSVVGLATRDLAKITALRNPPPGRQTKRWYSALTSVDGEMLVRKLNEGVTDL